MDFHAPFWGRAGGDETWGPPAAGGLRVVGRPEPVKLIETSGGWIYPTCLLRLDGGPGLVDPHPGRQPGGLGRAPEPVGACGEGVVEDLLAAGLGGPSRGLLEGGGGG